MIQNSVECSGCGALSDAAGDTPADSMPCPFCGAKSRIVDLHIAETVVLRDGWGTRAKRAGDTRPYVEDIAMPSFSHRLDKHVLREQVIDRDNDRYFEKVTDYECGEVIHQNEEPLSKHRGHGSAKVKRKRLKMVNLALQRTRLAHR